MNFFRPTTSRAKYIAGGNQRELHGHLRSVFFEGLGNSKKIKLRCTNITHRESRPVEINVGNVDTIEGRLSKPNNFRLEVQMKRQIPQEFYLFLVAPNLRSVSDVFSIFFLAS